jgi:site-specific DNA-cytosine methylase
LEIFSGTGSIGRAFGAGGWEVVSLDIACKAHATICADIKIWDNKAYEVGYFDVIWASPACTHYIIARTKACANR